MNWDATVFGDDIAESEQSLCVVDTVWGEAMPSQLTELHLREDSQDQEKETIPKNVSTKEYSKEKLLESRVHAPPRGWHGSTSRYVTCTNPALPNLSARFSGAQIRGLRTLWR